MNDPVVKNFGRLMGRRLLLIPIMMGVGLACMALLGVLLMVVGAFAGSGGEGLILLVFLAFLFLFLVAVVGGALFLGLKVRQKKMAAVDGAFSWLSMGRSYMINGRQYGGVVDERAVAVKVSHRPRGAGAVMNFEIPANLPGRIAIGTRTSVGTLIQGMTSSFEVEGVGLDQKPYALSTIPECEGFARWFMEQEGTRENVESLMQALSGYEIRAIRLDHQLATFVISHPEQGVYQPEYSQYMMNLLMNLVRSIESQGEPRRTSEVETSAPTNEPSVIDAELVSATTEPNDVASCQMR